MYEGAVGKKNQNSDFYCTRLNFHYFWTCHFVKFDGLTKMRNDLKRLTTSKK